jgi:hypothetical protein
MPQWVLDEKSHIAEGFDTDVIEEDAAPTRIGDLPTIMTLVYLAGKIWVQVTFPRGNINNAVDLSAAMNSVGYEYWDNDLVEKIKKNPTMIAVWCYCEQAGWPNPDTLGEHNLYDLEDMVIGQVGSIRTIWGGLVLVQRTGEDTFYHVVLEKKSNGEWVALTRE